MDEIVNLRLERKRKLRAAKELLAAAERLAHGRTRREKKGAELTRALEEKRIEGHRRRRPGEPGGNS